MSLLRICITLLSYLTILTPMQELTGIKFVEKRSKFFAHLYSIDSPEEMGDILKLHRRKYKKANHHCYAIRFIKGAQQVEISKDDGEVGHPGKVLLEILTKNDMGSHVLIVSRIFGGIKLGVGGVSRAFRVAGNAVLDNYDSGV